MDDVNLADLMNDTAPATAEVVSTETTTEQTGQTRDEQGRFANTQATDHDAQAAVEGGAAATTEQPTGTVPQQALHEARQQQKAERERADRLERELLALRQPAKPKEEAKPKSFWENPDEFLAERTAPIQQEAVKRHMMTSRMLAEDKFGPETVKAADDALGSVMQANPNDPSVIALAQKIKDSAHPFRDMIEWHKEHQARAEIGNDPAAYRAKIEAEILAKYNITPEAAAAIAAEVTPPANVATPSTTTNASPVTKLPKSLTKLPGGGNAAADGDVSDESVFAHAIGR